MDASIEGGATQEDPCLSRLNSFFQSPATRYSYYKTHRLASAIEYLTLGTFTITQNSNSIYRLVHSWSLLKGKDSSLMQLSVF